MTKYIDLSKHLGFGFSLVFLFFFKDPKPVCVLPKGNVSSDCLVLTVLLQFSSQLGLCEPFTWKSRNTLKGLLGVKLAIQTPPLTLQSVLHNSSPCYVMVMIVPLDAVIFRLRDCCGGGKQVTELKEISFRLLETKLPWDLGGRRSILELQGRM